MTAPLLIGIGIGAIIAFAGIVILALSRDIAEWFEDSSKYTMAPSSMFTPGAAGCAGVAAIGGGLLIIILVIASR